MKPLFGIDTARRLRRESGSFTFACASSVNVNGIWARRLARLIHLPRRHTPNVHRRPSTSRLNDRKTYDLNRLLEVRIQRLLVFRSSVFVFL